jgi:hypothetical protein
MPRVGFVVLSLLVGIGCVGNDPPPTAGPSAAADAGTSDPGALPKPTGLVYHDGDLRNGFLGATITIKKASDESNVGEYRVYFGTSETKKLLPTPLVTAKAGGADNVVEVPSDTQAPETATHLLVYAATVGGLEGEPVATPLVDNSIIMKTPTVAA